MRRVCPPPRPWLWHGTATGDAPRAGTHVQKTETACQQPTGSRHRGDGSPLCVVRRAVMKPSPEDTEPTPAHPPRRFSVSRTAAVLVLLLAPALARADAGPPSLLSHPAWVDYVFTVEQDYPDYEFYLVTEGFSEGFFPPERLPLNTAAPARVAAEPRYKFRQV